MNNPQPVVSAPAVPLQQGWRALPRTVWLAGAALLLTIAGLASALVLRHSASNVDEPPVAAAAMQPGAQGKAGDKHGGTQHARAGSPAYRDNAYPNAPTMPVANACPSCGVVESVQAVQHKGQGTGVGAVAGGVVGGLLGNQMGGGNGKTAMTVLGAVGGGFAGNEIEKRARSETVYNVKVRMEDGTLRTVTQKQAPAIGQHVSVEGQNLRVLSETQGSAPQGAARTWNTSAPANGTGI